MQNTSSPQQSLFGPLGLLGALIALGMLFFGHQAVRFFRNSERTVTVRGLIEESIRADLGQLQITISASGNQLADTHQKLKKHLEKTRAFFLSSGLSAQEISLESLEIKDYKAPRWSHDFNKDIPERYLLQQNILLRSKKVEKIQELVSNLGPLLAQGITFTETSIKFILSDFENFRPELLGKALSNARKMAQEGLQQGGIKGLSIGPIKNVTQGQIEILSPNQAGGVPSYLSSHEKSSEKILRLVVHVTFTLDDASH